MDKPALRQKYKNIRRSFSPAMRLAYDGQILQRSLMAVKCGAPNSLHIYRTTQDEVDTQPILDFVWQNYPAIVTATSRVVSKSKIEAVKIDKTTTKWRANKFGILEPATGIVLPPDFKFDLIFVPTLAFDEHGYRLGYGGGYYDRFLVGQPDAHTVGLCYEQCFVEDGLPHEPHDIPLKMVLTETKTHNYN